MMFTIVARRMILVEQLPLLQIPETIHERRMEDPIMTTPLIIRTGLPSHDGDRKAFEEITSI
jgi:hypothetical protein